MINDNACSPFRERPELGDSKFAAQVIIEVGEAVHNLKERNNQLTYYGRDVERKAERLQKEVEELSKMCKEYSIDLDKTKKALKQESENLSKAYKQNVCLEVAIKELIKKFNIKGSLLKKLQTLVK
jgi:predicted RNase H-like nuclease (RuvC/YqgF family)